jgi:UPF0716 protein FxsA
MAVLFVLFLVVPAIELYLIIQSSQAFGFANTLGALIVISMFGAWLARREGTRVWAKFNQAIAAGQVPSQEIADGVCVLGAGALLMTPGFLTDVFGILLMFPPTRAVFRKALVNKFSGRVTPGRTSAGHATYRGGVYDTTAEPTPPASPHHDGPANGEINP